MTPHIKVAGVGGSGSNTISRMAKFSLPGVELLAFNTDVQALRTSKADKKILIGKNLTNGLGTGMDAALGKLAADETKDEIVQSLKGADMLFVTCGFGGGTGSGAAPVIAGIAKEMGILTIVVVTTPFSFEGAERKKIADAALRNLEGKMDSLLVISNDNLLKVVTEKTTVANAFEICDSVLHEAVKGITDLILTPGIVNIDFASIVSILKNAGRTLFGTAKASGPSRMELAAEAAVNSPLLDFSIKGSKGVLFHISGQDITLTEVRGAADVITKNVDPKAQIIFGATIDKTLKKGEVKVTVIATKL